MSAFATNRPFKTGANDRREFIFQDSEVGLVAINDGNGNPVFLGRSKTGTALSVAKWQIRKITYDTNQGVSRVEWPENSEGNSSSNYEFVWNSETNLSVTAVSKANPGVVTVSDLQGLEDGDLILFQDIGGMIELNFDGDDTIFTVANINVGAKTFELSGVDTSSYTTYTSGGTGYYGEFVNYTYN